MLLPEKTTEIVFWIPAFAGMTALGATVKRLSHIALNRTRYCYQVMIFAIVGVLVEHD
jgi:hypothetical protein